MTYSTIFNGLKKTIQENLDTVIFTDRKSRKFVQYALDHSDGKVSITLDIPVIECDENEKTKLSTILSGKAYDVRTGKEIAYQEYFWGEELENATKISHQIFTEVFKSKPDYSLEIEMF